MNEEDEHDLSRQKAKKNNNSSHRKNNKNRKNRKDRWAIVAVLLAFCISISISLISESVIKATGIFLALLALIIIMAIGVIFDIIGVAVTAASEAPFHARASRKIPGSALAVNMVKNADKVSSLCNDIIGDIASVVSGAAGAVISGKLILLANGNKDVLISILISAAIASFTIGGKALGKNYAINNCDTIVYRTAYILDMIINEPKRYILTKLQKDTDNE